MNGSECRAHDRGAGSFSLKKEKKMNSRHSHLVYFSMENQTHFLKTPDGLNSFIKMLTRLIFIKYKQALFVFVACLAALPQSNIQPY